MQFDDKNEGGQVRVGVLDSNRVESVGQGMGRGQDR